MPSIPLHPKALVFLIACLLAALACQSAGEATPTAAPATSVAATQPAASPTAGSGEANPTEPAATEPPVEDEVFGPGAFDLPAPGLGLAELSGYHATLTLTFDGTRAGQPEQWTRYYDLLVSRDPAARQLNIEAAGANPGRLTWVEINGVLYEHRDEAACTVSVVPPEHSLAERWELTIFLSQVLGADEAGSETVNGVDASHYTFNEQAMGEAGLAASTGELWVAASGGYLVRYALSTAGDAAYFGGELEGRATLTYELTESNTPAVIQVPADCPAGLVNAPRLPDAAEVVDVPGLLGYTTQAAPADAAIFYQQELSALGWQPATQTVFGAEGGWQEYVQGNQHLSVIIALGETGTTVQLVQTPLQP